MTEATERNGRAKIVFATRMGEEQLAALGGQFPGATFVSAPDLESQLRELPDADAVISWPQAEALARTERLRWVHCTSAGIERIRSVPQLVEMDAVTLTNGRGAHAGTIADHTFAFILAFTRNLRDIMEDQKAHRWERPARSHGARELSGSTMGILGLGRIGSEIARRATGFGVDLIAVDANPAATAPGVDGVWPLERLDDLLRTVDYLAIAVPITPATRGLIGARELALMKPDAYLCVMSRGGIVDQDALAGALASGRLAGAGLDATDPEPLPAEHPLWDLPNVIISPHCSGASRQTGERGRDILHQNLTRFLAGQPLMNQCDKRAGY
jgi:phosphoglycerate dehydrogenase-like enzyme